MDNDLQTIIDEISESDEKPVKITKKSEKDNKNYLKTIVFNEKTKNPTISSTELSKNFGVSKDDVELYFKEFELLNKKKDEKELPKKPSKIKKEVIKLKEKVKKIKLDKTDVELLKNIILKIVLYGIPINFSLFVIFGFMFNWYSWIGWGYCFWFIQREVVKILRSLWIR